MVGRICGVRSGKRVEFGCLNSCAITKPPAPVALWPTFLQPLTRGHTRPLHSRHARTHAPSAHVGGRADILLQPSISHTSVVHVRLAAHSWRWLSHRNATLLCMWSLLTPLVQKIPLTVPLLALCATWHHAKTICQKMQFIYPISHTILSQLFSDWTTRNTSDIIHHGTLLIHPTSDTIKDRTLLTYPTFITGLY